MKSPRIHHISLLATVAAAFCAASLSAATTYTVASGESLTLDASSNNQAGNQITLQDGATLVAPVSGDGYTIKARISVTGAARLDLASTPTSTYYLRIAGGLAAANDTCSLTVGGGLTQVFFGAMGGDGTITYNDAAVDGTGVHYPLINLKNLHFDATQNGSFTFRANSASTVVQVPTTCRVGFASGSLATLALKGNDVFAQLGQTAPYSPTNFNAVVLDRVAVPAGTLVKVPAGRTMAVKPCNVNGWTWAGNEQEVCFDVELEGEDSILLFRTVNSGWTRFVGDITGAGKVYVRGETGNSSGSRVMFNGDIACGGGLQLSDKGEVRYGPDASWRTKASHWFDAADTNSYVMFTAEPPAGRTTQVGDAESGYFDTIVGWKDTIKGTNDVFCYNTRMWANGRQPKENYVVQVLPYIVPKGLNGLNYICFGKAGGICTAGWGLDTTSSSVHSRRLPFWRGDADGANLASGASANFQCKYAIMVFGSQQGGGWALLGTTGSSAGRLTREKTLNDPWLGSNAPYYDLIVDGTSVNPGTDKPNGGWQIVSIDMTRKNTTVNALGAQSADGPNATAAGGQNYAEVILFDEKPTDSERLACERYLAKKWGLTGSYTGGIVNEYRLNSANSSTSVKVFGDVTLSGVYDGAMTVDDRSTVSFSREMPPTEADIPAAGRVGWFDPDFDLTRLMRTNNVNRPLELDGVLCRTADGVDSTRGWMGGARGSDAQNRSPWIDESSHNGGPVRHWIDFRDIYDKTYDDSERIMGNMLRYRSTSAPYSESVMKNTASSTFNIQQAFLVLDTSAGGGTPLLDKSGADGVVKARYGTTRPGDTYSRSIHANGERKTQGVFLGGKAWLNKVQVDPYTHGFTGKPEILTLETTGDFPVGFLAYYGNHDGYRDGNYEIMGETIFYSAPLTDENRAKVQDYLIYKWLGKMDGAVYSDATAARVTGSGTIAATDFADEALPNLSSFTGTLAITNDVTLVVGETVLVPCSVALPSDGTLTVTIPANTASDTYTLLSATAITGGEGMTVAFDGAGAPAHTAKFVRVANSLSVTLHDNGFIMVVR